MKLVTPERSEWMLPEIQKQVDHYKKFKALTAEWAEIATELAKLKYLDLGKA